MMLSPVAERAIKRTVKPELEQQFSSCSNHYQSPADFAARRLFILDKQKKLMALTYNAVQHQLMTSLTGRDLVLKPRQVGISTAIQGWLYQEAVSGTATTMTLAHDDDGRSKLRRIADRFHKHDPHAPKRGAANARLTTYPDTDSEVLIATAGNRTSGRGSTLTHLHGSEVAYWPDAESIVAGAIQAGEPKVVLESTGNGAQGYFYGLCMEALDESSDWRLHFYPWWVESGYALALDEGEAISFTDEEMALIEAHDLTPEQIKWRRAKQRELKHLFIQEYPEDPQTCFLRSGFGYFGDMSAALTAPMGAEYQADHRYVAGLDFGQTVDYTALSVSDATANVEVELLRVNQLSWSEMRARVVQACKRWNVSVLLAEKNSMGSTNTEELRKELRAAGLPTRVREFVTSNESKSEIMSALHETLHAENGLRLLPDKIARREIEAFTAVQLPSGLWRLSGPDSEHDDTVIARALMNRARFGGSVRAETW